MLSANRRKATLALGAALLVALLAYTPVTPRLEAGNGLRIGGGASGFGPDGGIFVWSLPVNYTVDGGALGVLSNAQAQQLVADGWQPWIDVATSSFNAVNAGGIDTSLVPDGDVSTLDEFAAIGCSGNPVIFDADGSLSDDLGFGDSILGFAGPCGMSSSGIIVSGRAFLNGGQVPNNDQLTLSTMLGTAIHEFGHMIGLGHSQININCSSGISCGLGSDDIFGVPTMYPTALPSAEVANEDFATTLAVDDQAWISFLYPDGGGFGIQAAFADVYGRIDGNVFFSDGETGVQGANVIARSTVQPRRNAVSSVSGFRAKADHGHPTLGFAPSDFGSPDPALRGFYQIPVPGGASYTVEVETVGATFVGGSSVGPLSGNDGRGENIPLPGPAEFLSNAESNADDPGDVKQVAVTAGAVAGGQNIILNGTSATFDQFESAGSRNDTSGTATEIGNGTFRASISPFNSGDVDWYRFTATAGSTVTIEIIARRLAAPGDVPVLSFLDSVLEIRQLNGTLAGNCRPGNTAGAFDQVCVNDDFDDGLGGTGDSKLEFQVPADGDYFAVVSDAYLDGRPDFQYDIVITGVVDPQAAQADLVVTKTDDADPVTVGDTVTYTITVTNNGPDAAANVALNDVFSGAAVTLTSVTPSQGTCDSPAGNPFACNLGNLANGASATVTVAVTADAEGTITNTVSATSDTADPNGANNTNIAQTTTVNAAAPPDLAISKTHTGNATVGDTAFEFTITVSNVGSGPTTGAITVTDNLPAGLVVQTVSGNGWNCDLTVQDPPQTVVCTRTDPLGPGADSTITLTVVVNVGAYPSATNNVSVSTPGDTNAANDSDSDTVTVLSPDLVVTKTDSADPVTVGDPVTYTISVTNQGNGAMTQPVFLNDVFTGAAVTILSAAPGAGQGDCSFTNDAPPTVNCNLFALGVGESATVTIQVTADAAGTITNTVSADPGVPDPTPADNTDIVETTTVNEASPCTINFDNSNGNGQWQEAGNWDLDRLPNATDTACIGGSFAVTLSSGNHEVNTLTVSSSATFTLAGGTLTINSVGSSSIGAGGFIQSGGTLTGPGTLNIQGLFTFSGGVHGGTGITNTLGGFTVTNALASKTLARTLNNSGATATLQAGDFFIAAGGAIVSTSEFEVGGGRLFGSHGVNIQSDLHFTGGSVHPGADFGVAGILNVVGNYQGSSAASLIIELGGLTAGTQYSRLAVTGAADITNVRLQASTFGGFTPALGNTFTILTATGGRTGQLSTSPAPILPALPAGLEWDIQYTATEVILAVVAADACTINFDNSNGNGLWQEAGNWDLDRLPNATDTACIGGSFAVTLSSGNHEVNTLTVTSTGEFTLAGGTLTINSVGSSSIGAGGFIQSGGTLTGPGTLNVSSSFFEWSGGVQGGTGTTNANGVTLTGAGTKTLARTLANTGAALLNGGVFSIETGGNFSTTSLLISGGQLQGVSGATLTGNVSQTGGVISPGLSPGILNVVGDLVQSAGGSILLEIAGTGGPGAANGHDQANISGSADVNGTFNIVLINGFIPAIGDTFTVATRGSGPDSNPTINLPALPPDRAWDEVDDPNALILTVVAAGTQADLVVTKTDNADPVLVGDTVTYTVTVTNNGPDAAANVTLSDTFTGAAVTIDSVVPSQGACTPPAGGAFTCNLGNLASGISATVTITVTTLAAGTVTNTVSAASDTADPNAANNSNIVQTTTVSPVADLVVTKTDDADPVLVGDTVTYTITITNNGPSPATNIALTDTFSGAGVTVTSIVHTSDVCDAPTNPFSCNIALLGAGQAFVVTVQVTADDPGTITNTVTATAATHDPNPANNTNIVQNTTVVAPSGADLVVTKTDSADPVILGDQVTYTVTVTNNGPDAAANVTLSDTFTGAAVTIDSVVPSQGACTPPAGGAFTCNLGNLANGVSATVTITVTTLAAGTVTNTVSAASDTADPNAANNTNIVQTTTVREREADLAVTKADNADPVTVGDAVTYTVTITNHGPDTSEDVMVFEEFTGAAVTIDSVVPSQGTCGAPAGGFFTCDLGDLANGASATITITVTTLAAGTVTNTASAFSFVTTDPVDGNNIDIVETTTVLAPQADLEVSKTDSPDPVLVGGTVTYTIDVRNGGPADAVNITLTDTFSGAAVTILSATTTATGGSCQINGLQVSCILGNLGDDGTTSVTIVVTADAVGTITNTAVVASDTADPSAANNTAIQTTTVNAPVADLRVTKSASASSIVQGESVTFTVVVHNDGPNAAANVSLADTLSGVPVTVTGRTTTQGSCAPAGGGSDTACDLGTLAAGASATITLTVTANGSGTLVNSATATSDAGDPNAANNTSIQASVTVVPPNPLPTITSINPAEVVVGGGGFNLTVTGTNFVSGAVVRVGGADRSTTFNSATQLTAAIPASDIATAGTRQITVFNPAPGGGLSNALTLRVADFQLAATTQQQTVPRGAAAQFNIRITPLAPGFSGTVTFSASGLPPLTTASFNPASVVPGANPADTVLTISTTAGGVVFRPPAGQPPGWPVAPVAALWLLLAAGLGVAVRAAQPERRRRVAAMAAVILVMAMAVGAAGCFGGGFPHERPESGTPAGTYPITVRATSGSLERTTQVTLVVQ